MKDYNANIILSAAGAGLGLSVTDVQNVLGLIITVINLAILLVSLGLKFYKYIKNDGKLDKSEIEDLSKDIKDIQETIEKDGKK